MISCKKNIPLFNAFLYLSAVDPEGLSKAIQEITKGIEEKILTPIVSKTFPLDQTHQAFEYMESNQQVGKVVITP